MQAQAGFYIEYMDSGEPYLGYEFNDGVMSVRTVLATKMTLAGVREQFLTAARELMKTPEKLIAAEGGALNGLRSTQGG